MNMKPHNQFGLLITFCGLDGCGKTSMINMLKNKLDEMNIPILLTKQPTDFVRKSDIFRTYMDCPDHDEYDYRSLCLLAASDRVQHSNKVILPALEEGKIVISDRYFYSCLAILGEAINSDFQSLKIYNLNAKKINGGQPT
jgi:dTMP kinase